MTRAGATVSARTPGDTAPDSVRELRPGDVLKDRFVIESVIGTGGMGVVYRALDLRREESRDREPHVAVKVLNERFRGNPEMVIALQREAHKAQTLAHPNIATVYDFDRDGDLVYLTMELLEGEPLEQIIAEHPAGLSRRVVLHWLRGLCLGLAYAHNRQIVHSDFKPDNVFFVGGSQVKILDFGIARAVPADHSSQSRNPAAGAPAVTEFDPGTLGALTPAYASCEMFEGKPPHPSDDVYALAVVAYQLLTGRHPFDGRPAPVARDAKLVPAPVPGLTRREWRAIRRGLSFDRAHRQPDASALLRELEGPPRSARILAASLVVVVGALGYTAFQQLETARALAPDVAFESLPQETRERFGALIDEGDTLTTFSDSASALDRYVTAYRLHPRNTTAADRIEALFGGLADAARTAEDRSVMADNLRAVLAIDDFLKRRLEPIRERLEDPLRAEENR